MVRYYSDDGVVDAPVEKVWRLIQAHNDPKNHIHAGIVSMSGKPQPDGSVLADVVTKGENGNVSHKWRFTIRPPHAQVVDMLEGPMKGSWITTAYIPEGANKTRYVTVAEWNVQGVTDEKTLLKLCNDFMENGFEEDMRFLKTLS